MVGRAHDWFNSRRWFIRVLLYAEWVILAIFAMTSAGVRFEDRGRRKLKGVAERAGLGGVQEVA